MPYPKSMWIADLAKGLSISTPAVKCIITYIVESKDPDSEAIPHKELLCGSFPPLTSQREGLVLCPCEWFKNLELND